MAFFVPDYDASRQDARDGSWADAGLDPAIGTGVEVSLIEAAPVPGDVQA
jgi:hypothetical protein